MDACLDDFSDDCLNFIDSYVEFQTSFVEWIVLQLLKYNGWKSYIIDNLCKQVKEQDTSQNRLCEAYKMVSFSR